MTMPGALNRKPLRLWPGVVLAVLLCFVRFLLPRIAPDEMIYAVLGGLAGGILIILWWLLFSRAPWVERVGAIVLMAAGLYVTRYFVDVSIATGAQRFLFPFLAIPPLGAAFVAWAVVTRHLSTTVRRASMAATILLACGAWTLVRTGGFTASFQNDLHWRWTQTPEERLVAQLAGQPAPVPPPPPAAAETPAAGAPAKPAQQGPARGLPRIIAEPPARWPGFRGPHRDGVVSGVRINTDWTAAPPTAMWRRPIGPGWSSFAVRGGLLYTQEQRGPEEVVSCYRLTTGEPVWAHKDPARFWESNGGPGPRSTPTVSNGRVYTMGATGILNALNANDGSVIWSRNAASDAAMKLPDWGFASSPLVVDELVIAAPSGRLVAYDIGTGAPRWFGPPHGTSYSSPQMATIGGVPQILLLSAAGVTSVELSSGKVLWEHTWKGYPIVQPALTADGNVLMSVTDSSGIRRIAVAHSAEQWSVEERWTSTGLKPYFNDFIVHKDHAYGFDGSILSCIDLKDGKRVWKGGRYGNGQLILLPEQDVLLVLSELGELALVKATPDQFTELARFPALEGKTWNHPVLAGDVLLVRNGEEMAAFRLSTAERAP